MKKHIDKLNSVILKKVELDLKDISVGTIISKQNYSQNKIKYDRKYREKHLFGKSFLLENNEESKIFLSTYLDKFMQVTKKNNGILILHNCSTTKDSFAIGDLKNITDNNSLIKLEYLKDKYFEDNIHNLHNFIMLFADNENGNYVITDNKTNFLKIIKLLNIEHLKFIFINEKDINKINKEIVPFWTKTELIKPIVIISFLCFFIFTIISSTFTYIITEDIENAKIKKIEQQENLTRKNFELDNLKNNEYYKNRDYYESLTVKEIYLEGIE